MHGQESGEGAMALCLVEGGIRMGTLGEGDGDSASYENTGGGAEEDFSDNSWRAATLSHIE